MVAIVKSGQLEIDLLPQENSTTFLRDYNGTSTEFWVTPLINGSLSPGNGRHITGIITKRQIFSVEQVFVKRRELTT